MKEIVPFHQSVKWLGNDLLLNNIKLKPSTIQGIRFYSLKKYIFLSIYLYINIFIWLFKMYKTQQFGQTNK